LLKYQKCSTFTFKNKKCYWKRRFAVEMLKNGELWVGDSVGVIMKAFLMFPELFV
jgi:hypothetical protein